MRPPNHGADKDPRDNAASGLAKLGRSAVAPPQLRGKINAVGHEGRVKSG